MKMLDKISVFLNLLRLVLCPTMWAIFENDPCAFEKNVYFASLVWKLYKCQLSAYHLRCHSMPQILVDFLFGWCVHSWQFSVKILYKDCIAVDLLQDFLVYLGAPMLGAYIFTMFMSSWWILPLSITKWPSGSLFMVLLWKSILCDMSIATPAFFFLSLCLENLFPALHFQSV